MLELSSLSRGDIGVPVCISACVCIYLCGPRMSREEVDNVTGKSRVNDYFSVRSPSSGLTPLESCILSK